MAGRRGDKVTVEFLADIKNLQRGLDRVERDTKSTSEKMKGSFDRIKTGIGFAFGAVAANEVIDFAKKMDDVATRAEGVERRFDTVFGDMADSMSEWVDEQNEAFGVSKTGLKEMAAAVQDLLVPMGFTRAEAGDMTQQILETGNALSEWTGGAIDTRDAIDRLNKGILGEREGLKELGIKISEADVKTQLLKNGTADLTGEALEQAKAQATLELVLGKSTDALSAYEDRVGTALAANKELSASVEETEQTFAQILKPELEFAKEEMAGLAEAASRAATGLAEMRGAGDDAAAGQVSLLRELENLTLVLRPADLISALFARRLEDQADAADDGSRAYEEYGSTIRDWTEDTEDATDATEDATDAVQDLADEQRAAADPAFALARATREHNEAQETLQRLQAEGKEGTGEWQKAVEEAASAAWDMNAAQRELASSGSEWEDVLRTNATQWGLTSDQVQRYIDLIKTANESTPGLIGGTSLLPGDSFSRNADGGPVSAGEVSLVGERGPEIVQFPRSGRVVPNHQIGGASSEPIVLVTQLVLPDGRVLAEAVREYDRSLA